jgi:hypothetical protein
MRKYRYLAVAAAGVMVLAAPAAAFASAHTSSGKPVLTVGKVGGTAVKKGAKLGASLVKKTDVSFAIGKYGATCSKSSYTSKVVKNPSAKGKATLSLTAETLSGCKLLTAPLPGLTLASLTAIDLPADITVTAKDAVTVSEASTASPIGFSANVDDSGTLLATCVYTATKVTGKGSNKGNTVAFSKQVFKLNSTLTPSKYLSTCEIAGTSSTFSATYGPVKSSGKAVFVG